MPRRRVASQDAHASTKLPSKSSHQPRSARAAGQGQFVRQSLNQRRCVRSAASPGSCDARRTCGRVQRACSIPCCQVPTLIGPEARWRRRRRSGVRFAMSRCASLARAGGTTGLKHFPGPPACPLERRGEPGSWPIALSPAVSSSLGSSQLLRLGVFTHTGYCARTGPNLCLAARVRLGFDPASPTQPGDEIAYVLESSNQSGTLLWSAHSTDSRWAIPPSSMEDGSAFQLLVIVTGNEIVGVSEALSCCCPGQELGRRSCGKECKSASKLDPLCRTGLRY